MIRALKLLLRCARERHQHQNHSQRRSIHNLNVSSANLLGDHVKLMHPARGLPLRRSVPATLRQGADQGLLHAQIAAARLCFGHILVQAGVIPPLPHMGYGGAVKLNTIVQNILWRHKMAQSRAAKRLDAKQLESGGVERMVQLVLHCDVSRGPAMARLSNQCMPRKEGTFCHCGLVTTIALACWCRLIQIMDSFGTLSLLIPPFLQEKPAIDREPLAPCRFE